MIRFLLALFIAISILGCAEKESSHQYSSVEVQTIFEDSTSIRAIEFLDSKTLAFAGSRGMYGTVDVETGKVRTNQMRYDTIIPEFRAVGHTESNFFMLSVSSPALLYKTGDKGQMDLVYVEEGEGVFYDSMRFWNNKEGIAIGDGENGCLSVLITRDGGNNWNKISCNRLPNLSKHQDQENNDFNDVGAFAASNTNIAIVNNKTWVMTSRQHLLFSPDRGKSWELIIIPINIHEHLYQGIYSIDFYDKKIGFGVGGSFVEPAVIIQIKLLQRIRAKHGVWYLKIMAQAIKVVCNSFAILEEMIL